MTESFVDLTYRGLSLGRRIKLTEVRPTSGYLEMPAPMPVGTAISIATDEGLVIDAQVVSCHEQIGGSTRAPGMLVAPVLADDASEAWWKARVALPEETAAPAPDASPDASADASAVPSRSAPVTVRPRSHTVPEPMPASPSEPTPVPPPAPPPVDEPTPDVTLRMPAVVDADAEVHGARTTVMAAVDPALIAEASGAHEAHAIVDDGKKTIVMDAVDPAALGLDLGGDGGASKAQEPAAAPSPAPTTKRRRRRR